MKEKRRGQRRYCVMRLMAILASTPRAKVVQLGQAGESQDSISVRVSVVRRYPLNKARELPVKQAWIAQPGLSFVSYSRVEPATNQPSMLHADWTAELALSARLQQHRRHLL